MQIVGFKVNIGGVYIGQSGHLDIAVKITVFPRFYSEVPGIQVIYRTLYIAIYLYLPVPVPERRGKKSNVFAMERTVGKAAF
jgi:hypothetical protein